MTHPDASRRLGIVLHDVARLLRRRFDKRGAPLKLTRAQWAVIAQLYRQDGLMQAALAELVEVSQITLARQVDRLEAAGWVRRRPHPADRRAKCVFLTAQGHALLAQARAVSDQVQAEALHGITPKQHTLIVDLLLRMKTNLLAADGAAEPGTARAARLPALPGATRRANGRPAAMAARAR